MEQYLNKYNTESEYNSNKLSFENNTVSVHDYNEVEYDKFNIPYNQYKSTEKSEVLGEWKLNDGTIPNPTSEGYTTYISDSNYNVHNSESYIKIGIPAGMHNVIVLFYSDGETTYDFTSLGVLDVDLRSADQTVANTAGKQKTWLSYTYSISDDKEHFFMAKYRKDRSESLGKDRGAIAINFTPSNINTMVYEQYTTTEKYLGFTEDSNLSTKTKPYVMLNSDINYQKDTSLIEHDSKKLQSPLEVNLYSNDYLNSRGWIISDYDSENYKFSILNIFANKHSQKLNLSGHVLKVFIPKNSGTFYLKYKLENEDSAGNSRISIYSATLDSPIDTQYYISGGSGYNYNYKEVLIENFEEDRYLRIEVSIPKNNTLYMVGNVYARSFNLSADIILPKKFFVPHIERTTNEIIYYDKVIDPIERVNIIGYDIDDICPTNARFQLYAKTYPMDYELGKFTWTSSNTNVAIIDNNGMVVTINPGETVITATSNDYNVSSSFNLKVKKYSNDITGIPSTLNLKVGESYTCNVDFSPYGSCGIISRVDSDNVFYNSSISEDGKSFTLTGILACDNISVFVYWKYMTNYYTNKTIKLTITE